MVELVVMLVYVVDLLGHQVHTGRVVVSEEDVLVFTLEFAFLVVHVDPLAVEVVFVRLRSLGAGSCAQAGDRGEE